MLRNNARHARAGQRSSTLHVAPGASEAVHLALVPYHPGLLPLPSVRVEAGAWTVDAVAGQQVFVLPAVG